MNYVNSNGEIMPANYDSLVFDFYYSDRLVYFDKERGSGGGSTSAKITKMFAKKVPTPIGTMFVKGDSIPDSIVTYDYEKIKEFVEQNKDTLLIDTLIFINQDAMKTQWNLGENFIYKCSYKNALKHGDEYSFYSIPELKNICIVGNFRLKIHGRWKYGQKHGEWIEYDKTGKVIAVKKYKRDRLVKETYV